LLTLAAGDVIDVTEADPVLTKGEVQSTSQLGEASKSKAGTSAAIKKQQKKGGSSMADVIKRKQSLMKIVGQRVPTNRVVNLAPSTARVLMRFIE